MLVTVGLYLILFCLSYFVLIATNQQQDFTQPSQAVQHHQRHRLTGLRWKLPYHLLDGLFFAASMAIRHVSE